MRTGEEPSFRSDMTSSVLEKPEAVSRDLIFSPAAASRVQYRYSAVPPVP